MFIDYLLFWQLQFWLFEQPNFAHGCEDENAQKVHNIHQDKAWARLGPLDPNSKIGLYIAKVKYTIHGKIGPNFKRTEASLKISKSKSILPKFLLTKFQ